MGEPVLAADPQTGSVEAEPVQAVMQDPISALLAVDLSDGSAITVTADHPVWVDAGNLLTSPGWLMAGQLHVGDALRTARGHDVTVVDVRRHVGRAVVYTLTVAKDHTFFVGAARVLVHNANCSPSEILAQAIQIATGRARGFREAAHHIVAYSHRLAPDARRILAKYGIGLNEADNGVILAKIYHKGLHTTDYFASVDYILHEAERQNLSVSEVRELLRLMAKDIEQGAFPY